MRYNSALKGRLVEYDKRIKRLEAEVKRLRNENEYYRLTGIKNEIVEIQSSFDKKIDESINLLTDEIHKTHKVEIVEKQREDLFSTWIKLTVSSILAVLGIILVVGIIKTWKEYPGKFIPVLFIVYGVAFVIMAIDLWKEKDRKYVLAIVSFIVSLIALLITIFEKIN